jgi:GT2 family glycosyltransferase
MDLSVIIPTCNRPRILALCLAALARQSLDPSRFEVLVCDDGSEQDLAPLVENAGLRNVRLLRQKQGGPASARNLGLAQANGELTLFLNDDAIPDNDLLLHHFLTHRGFRGARVAVLGRLSTARRYLGTRFGRILENANALFAYNGMRKLQTYDYNHFYTCNISLKTESLDAVNGFDADFRDAAAEDVELGYRLQKRGLEVLYNPDCLAWHEHEIAPADFCNINFRRGYWAMLFFHKHPDLPKAPRLSEERVTALRERLELEKERAEQALAELDDAYQADRAVALESLPDAGPDASPDPELKPLVELLHQRHYQLGLLANPLLGAVMERQTASAPASYDQERRRSLL